MSIVPSVFQRSMGKTKPRKKKALIKHMKISLKELYGTKPKKT